MHPTLVTALFSLLPLSLAANIPITVGNGSLVFNPAAVTANVGDTLTFSFYPKSHSVVQSSFADPCHPLAGGGFFSGFQPLSAGPGPVDFVVELNDTKPIWIYCSQTKESHCQNGMVMVVNQPALPSPNTLDAYRLAASRTGNSTSPPYIAGGIFVSRNSTSTTGRSSTVSSKPSGTGPSPSGSGPANAYSSSTNGAGLDTSSGTGSGVSKNITGGANGPRPVTFQGAASKVVIDIGVFFGAAVLLYSL